MLKEKNFKLFGSKNYNLYTQICADKRIKIVINNDMIFHVFFLQFLLNFTKL